MNLYFKVEYKYYITERISLLFIGFSPFVCVDDTYIKLSVYSLYSLYWALGIMF